MRAAAPAAQRVFADPKCVTNNSICVILISNKRARPGKGDRVPDEAGEHMIKTSKPRRDGMVRVTFTLPAREPAAAVSVVGDFNGWNPFAHPLRNRANRTRSASVTVPSGSTLRFRYLADGGRWFDDDSVSLAVGEDAVIAV
jgi:hypothetical protein